MSGLRRWIVGGVVVVWLVGMGGAAGWAGEKKGESAQEGQRGECEEKKKGGWRIEIPLPGGRGWLEYRRWEEMWPPERCLPGPCLPPELRPFWKLEPPIKPPLPGPPEQRRGPELHKPPFCPGPFFEYRFYWGPGPWDRGDRRRWVPFEFNGEVFYLVLIGGGEGARRER